MAQHEQNGSGAEPEPYERTESIWLRTDDSEEFGESATEVTQGPSTSTPTPREQWFGGFEGFEGAAPPPPPYARLPEDAPPPLQGTAFQAPAPEEDDEDTLDDPIHDSAEDPVDEPVDDPEEMRSSTVRLMPGTRDRPRTSGPWQEERRPQRPQRLGGPGGPGGPGREGQDPLGPRKLRNDSDVPEPEQLPPLEAERTERLDSGPGTDPGSPGPSPWSEPAPEARWNPGATGNREGVKDTGFGSAEASSTEVPSTEYAGTENLGTPNPWGAPGSGAAAPVERTEPLPERPNPPPSLTGPRDPGPGGPGAVQ